MTFPGEIQRRFYSHLIGKAPNAQRKDSIHVQIGEQKSLFGSYQDLDHSKELQCNQVPWANEKYTCEESHLLQK